MYSDLFKEHYRVFESEDKKKVVFDSGIEYNDFEIKAFEYLKSKSPESLKKIHLLKRMLDVEILAVNIIK